jgi:biopolymer transport protein TolR
MAFQININSNRRKRKAIINEINVMPLIDVMLVLLVIFMATAPTLISGVDVNLPAADSKALPGNDEPLVISIDKNNIVYIMNTEIAKAQLVAKLKAITNQKYDSRIFIRADSSLSYGNIMSIMTEISNAGFTHVGLVSQSKK